MGEKIMYICTKNDSRFFIERNASQKKDKEAASLKSWRKKKDIKLKKYVS